MKKLNGKRLNLGRIPLCFFMVCAFFTLGLIPQASTLYAAPSIPAHLSQESLSLAPYLEAYVDETGALDIEDIQNSNIQKKFRPYALGALQRQSGVLWLRFTLAAQDAKTATDPSALGSETVLLDMGDSMAQKPLLYVPEGKTSSQTQVWQKYSPSQRAIFLMPEAQKTPITAYLRMDAVPSIWFVPFLRTPHNAATSLELMAYPAGVVALFIVMLLCLLRAFTEKGQWRIWAGLYTAVVLFYAIKGLPINNMPYVPMQHLAAVLAPGLALILLPHVGRHIMNTPEHSRAIDIQYMALSLLGALVALLPLIPGSVWLVRYLEFWPVLTLLFVPTTLAAWMKGFTGSRRFLIACFFPPLGVALALIGLEPSSSAFFPAASLAALPLWGVALGALVLTGMAGAIKHEKEEIYSENEGVHSVESVVQSDPNLRLVPVEEAQSLESEHMEEAQETSQKVTSDLEERLRWPVEQLSRQVAALETCALPVAARDAMESLTSTARDITSILDAPAKKRMPAPSMGGIEEHVFDLQSLLRQAHDSVSPVADKKNIALSWFMPPHLAQCYKGDSLQLLLVLRLLLESAVRATHRGAVQLAVRRVPESVNAGHLLFTVTDTGTGKPPQDRSVTALARAWEFSASYHGFLGVECNAHGASISFTANCEVCSSVDRETSEQVQQKAQVMPIILVSDNTEERHLWGFFLEKMENPVLEPRGSEEMVSLYKEHGAALIIFDLRMPLQAIEHMLQNVYQVSQEKDQAFPQCMAMYVQEGEGAHDAAILDAMGFAHVMALPVTRQKLCTHVEEILTAQALTLLSDETEEAHDTVEASEASETHEADGSHETLLPDVTEVQNSPQQVEMHNVEEEEEEIIDTGMPVLEMTPPQASVHHTLETENPLAEELHLHGDMYDDAPLQTSTFEELDMSPPEVSTDHAAPDDSTPVPTDAEPFTQMPSDEEEQNLTTEETLAEPDTFTPQDSMDSASAQKYTEAPTIDYSEGVETVLTQQEAKFIHENEASAPVETASLSDAIFLVDDSEEATTEDDHVPTASVQPASNEDILEESFDAAVEEHVENSINEPSSHASDATPVSDEEPTPTLRTSTRPAPAADKSNAAYLTSLVDDLMEEPATPKEEISTQEPVSATPTETSPIAPTTQEEVAEQSSETSVPSKVKQKPKIVIKKLSPSKTSAKVETAKILPAQQEESMAQTQESALAHEPALAHEQQTTQSSDSTAQSPENEAVHATAEKTPEPVMEIPTIRRLGKPKGKVPFERSAVGSVVGGHEWVGEPMPIENSPEAATAASLTPSTPQQAQQEEHNASAEHKAQERALAKPSPAKTKISIKQKLSPKSTVATAKQVVQAQEKPPVKPLQERPAFTEQAKDAPMASAQQVAAQDMSGEWVGEPMPVPKKDPAQTPVINEEKTPKKATVSIKPKTVKPVVQLKTKKQPQEPNNAPLPEVHEKQLPEPRVDAKSVAMSPKAPDTENWDMSWDGTTSATQKTEEHETSTLWDDAPLSLDTQEESKEKEAQKSPTLENTTATSKSVAEKRGREELRHLRDYLSKIEAVNPLKRMLRSDKAEASKPEMAQDMEIQEIQPQEQSKEQSQEQSRGQSKEESKEQKTKAFSPFDWVGEPTPVSGNTQNAEKQPPSKAPETLRSASKKVVPALRDLTKPANAKPAQLIPDETELSLNFDTVEEERDVSPIDSLLVDLDTWLAEAKGNLQSNHTAGVEVAVAAMANNAEAFGLRTLARLARTVEAAARAQDLGALHDLLPELEMSVHRNKAALRG